mmetsp:Transcript_49861/g.145007  ORF Transcript_49861/g.145007 Transcript_49861/m.145007 type:complete len:230 (-) Transcript_49861:1913-2602(-)
MLQLALHGAHARSRRRQRPSGASMVPRPAAPDRRPRHRLHAHDVRRAVHRQACAVQTHDRGAPPGLRLEPLPHRASPADRLWEAPGGRASELAQPRLEGERHERGDRLRRPSPGHLLAHGGGEGRQARQKARQRRLSGHADVAGRRRQDGRLAHLCPAAAELLAAARRPRGARGGAAREEPRSRGDAGGAESRGDRVDEAPRRGDGRRDRTADGGSGADGAADQKSGED